jgi:hypothetical protein
MLIPNKFNGYSRDGIRRYHIGGGVGEAMLLGAAVGGGSAAITGGDPLKGALLGGLTGGAGAGISSGLSSLAGTEAVLAPVGTEAVTNAAMNQALPVSTMAATPTTTGFTSIPANQSFAQASQAANATSGVNAAMNQALPLTGNLGIPSLLPPSTSPFITAPSSIAPTATAATSAAPQTFTQGMAKFANDPMASIMGNKFIAGASGLAGAMYGRDELEGPEEYDGPLKRFRFRPETYRSAQGYADGGITALASGGYDRMVGEEPMYQAMASGGISNLGTYSDGGRMLKGPGDGMSDSIPGVIGGKRPARLADGEFVVPADVVSHLGNGSTDAGARQLYSMMDKVRKARTGSKKQGREINPRKYALT